jgi:DUF4097 and DUF4098 domain-containing protein YvlB
MKASYLSFSRRAPCFQVAVGLGCAIILCLPSVARAAEGNLEKSFSVQPGGRLVVEVDRGAVQINTMDTAELKIQVKRRLKDVEGAQAAEIFNAHEVSFDQDGSRVEVKAKFKGDANKWLKNGKINYQVEYVINVPRKFDLDLKTAAGGVTSTDIEGVAKVRTAGGSIKFTTVKGSFDGETAAGGVSLERCTGPAILKTSGGSIELGHAESDATLHTAAGSITIRDTKAKLSAKSSGGHITLGKAEGPAELETAAGSIHVDTANARLDLKTAGGSIDVGNAREAVVARTAAGSISVKFIGQPGEDCNLSTAGGGITVTLPEDASFDVEAATLGGRIHTDLPITTTVTGGYGKDVLKGKLNKGGHSLILKTSAGNISIKKS